MKMVVRSGNFEVPIDKLGGEAPSPIEYLLASYAGCINIVGEIIAKEMNFKIHDIKVEVSGVFNAAKFMTGVGERAGYKEISTKVYVKSDVDMKTLEEWFRRVRERCPIEDNIANQTPLRHHLEKI
jgi:uncharacterized OsmC-like protein